MLDPRSRSLLACKDAFPRAHKIRIGKLKIGNHALAYLFATSLARLLQGPAEIGTHGIPELGVPAANLHLYEENPRVHELDSSYPWPTTTSLHATVRERLLKKLKQWQLQPNRSNGAAADYAHYAIKTNVPNLYPIRATSIGQSLWVDVMGAVCNLGYLPSLPEARLLLPGKSQAKQEALALLAAFEADPLVVHIRAGDILDGHNRHYIPTSAALVHRAAQATGRHLLFIGQLEDSELTRHLRMEFSDASFLYTGSAAVDFEMIRQAKHALLSTSTFAWLAAWLSERNETILLPRKGLFNPEGAPEINLIDCSDARFQFIIE